MMYSRNNMATNGESRAAATREQNRSRSDQEKSFLDNRDVLPVTHLSGRWMRTIQRLVVAGDDPDNLTISSAIPTAEDQAGGPVEKWSNADLESKDKIAIVAHGNVNEITLEGDDKDGKQLAAGLIGKKIENDTMVYLWACRAGVRENDDTKKDTSLVETTANELKDKGKTGINIEGFRGIHMFIGGDKSSRIVDPALTGGKGDVEMGYLGEIAKLNMHYVYLSGYFSKKYISKYMSGEWSKQKVKMKTGNEVELWSMDDKKFDKHSGKQTRNEFFNKEKEANKPDLPEWLTSQKKFDTEKDARWFKAGVDLAKDPEFLKMTIVEEESNRDEMIRTA